MVVLTIEDIARGKNLETFGESLDRQGIVDTANYYIENTSEYFPPNTKTKNTYPTIDSKISQEEKSDYVYNFQLLTYQLSKAIEENPEKIEDIFTKDARLALTLDNYCNKGCLHCVAESTTKNSDKLEYSYIKNLDERYFEIFKNIEFGRKGDPMLWKSNDYDIADVVELFADRNVNEVSIAAGLFKDNEDWYEKITDKLKQVRSENKELKIGTMLTYHHYLPNQSGEEIVKKFNESLLGCSKFSDNIVISILGDSLYDKSSIKNVETNFLQNFEKIFKGLELQKGEEGYITRQNNREIIILIPPSSSAVYPFGRFKKTLKKDGLYNTYLKQFNSLYSEPNICPDIIEWPGIVVEPNGDINTCGSFEAIENPQITTVSNILKPFEEVENDLLKLHEREKQWFLKNLPEIAFGKKSTCKIKNDCYN